MLEEITDVCVVTWVESVVGGGGEAVVGGGGEALVGGG